MASIPHLSDFAIHGGHFVAHSAVIMR
jgi:hypothetical protein